MTTTRDLTQTPTRELLREYGALLRQLRARGMVRSYNNPVADIAEWLGAKAFDLQLESASAKGYDAVGASGKRYQIKSRRITPENPSTQLGVMRDLADASFDFLLAIYFDEDFDVKAAYLLEHSAVVQHSLFNKAQRGHVLHAKGALLADSRCRDVTETCRGVSR